jgi:hypothetical protein
VTDLALHEQPARADVDVAPLERKDLPGAEARERAHREDRREGLLERRVNPRDV